jgi:hypothetical protein
MRSTLLALGACAVLAACGGTDAPPANSAAAASFVPPAPQRPTPLPGQAHTVPLAGFVGHYPDEPVDGVNFFDRTEVATALDGAVTDAKLRRAIIHNTGPRTPIFRAGARIATWGCEAHNCGNHNWTLLIDPVSGKGEVCMFDGTSSGSRWYAGGPPVVRPGGCPANGQD